jgi:Mrp family chromosome partitioning ATPase
MLHAQLTSAQAELRDRKNAFQRTSDSSRLSILENARDAMREKIYDLQLQESDLRSRYTDDYPLLQEIRRQREAAERLLIELPGGEMRPASFAATPSNDAAVQLAHTTNKPVAIDATAKTSKLESEVQKINAEEYELAQLEREVELLEGKYKMHVEKLEQARVNDELGREKIMNVKVAQPASLVHKPVAPMKTVILGLGGLLAFCGCIGLALVSESCDQTLRTTDQVEAQHGLPVLASLPYRKRRRRRRAKRGSKQQGARAGYQAMLRALRGSAEDGRRCAKTVGVVGCETAKSRSRVAGDLAIRAASSGADPVLLIDADARRRRIARRFHLNGSPGWCEIMRGNAVAKSCVKQSKLSNLAILGPGGAAVGSSEPGEVDDPRNRLDDLKSDFGLVVIDLPPAGELNSSIVANMVDEVVLVVEAERTRIQAAQRARDLLKRAGIHVAGVVLANRREHIPRWLYQRL